MIIIRDRATLASISELRTNSDEVLSHLKDSRVILERHKKPVAVMLDYAQYEKLEAMLDMAEDLILGAKVAKRDRKAKKSDFIDLEDW